MEAQTRMQEMTCDGDDRGDEQATAEEIRTDEEWWDRQFVASRDKLHKLAAEARGEIRAGWTYDMVFTDDGRIAP